MACDKKARQSTYSYNMKYTIMIVIYTIYPSLGSTTALNEVNENSDSHVSIMCNVNCINTGKIDKDIFVGELFCMILFYQTKQPWKYFDHERVEL